jgi:hypothetical protein
MGLLRGAVGLVRQRTAARDPVTAIRVGSTSARGCPRVARWQLPRVGGPHIRGSGGRLVTVETSSPPRGAALYARVDRYAAGGRYWLCSNCSTGMGPSYWRQVHCTKVSPTRPPCLLNARRRTCALHALVCGSWWLKPCSQLQTGFGGAGACPAAGDAPVKVADCQQRRVGGQAGGVEHDQVLRSALRARRHGRLGPDRGGHRTVDDGQMWMQRCGGRQVKSRLPVFPGRARVSYRPKDSKPATWCGSAAVAW